jgi:hypothetical protein
MSTDEMLVNMVAFLMEQLCETNRALNQERNIREQLESRMSSVLSPRPLSDSEHRADDETSSMTPRLNLLEALNIKSAEDEDKVITVRKVHKLGFKSASLLEQHFSRYGQVNNVVLLPMRARPKETNRGIRPSSMGFVVMATKSQAANALREPTQSVRGWPIEVKPFVRPSDKEPSA